MICSSISNIFSEFITVTASKLAFSDSDVSCLFSELSSSEEFKTHKEKSIYNKQVNQKLKLMEYKLRQWNEEKAT